MAQPNNELDICLLFIEKCEHSYHVDEVPDVRGTYRLMSAWKK